MYLKTLWVWKLYAKKNREFDELREEKKKKNEGRIRRRTEQ
jgi:hypothetical protein